MRQLRQQQGFTMIELIMVIVILGVLSAFALPRFADLGGSAREAAIEGAQGSVKSALGIVRAQVLASGTNQVALSGQTVTMDGANVNLRYGYPTAGDGTDPDADGIALASGLNTPEGTVVANQILNGDIVLTSGTANVLTVTLGVCSFTYTGATCATANQNPCAGAIAPPIVSAIAGAGSC